MSDILIYNQLIFFVWSEIKLLIWLNITRGIE